MSIKIDLTNSGEFYEVQSEYDHFELFSTKIEIISPIIILFFFSRISAVYGEQSPSRLLQHNLFGYLGKKNQKQNENINGNLVVIPCFKVNFATP